MLHGTELEATVATGNTWDSDVQELIEGLREMQSDINWMKKERDPYNPERTDRGRQGHTKQLNPNQQLSHGRGDLQCLSCHSTGIPTAW